MNSLKSHCNGALILKRFITFIFLSTFLNLSLAATENDINSLKKAYEDYDAGPVFVVAHRGCWSAAPENSVSAIEACIRLGVEVVEIDVQLTKEGVPIVFHDVVLGRMANGWGYVGDASLEDLKRLRLYERDGSIAQLAKHKFITNHQIPTLREIFEAARGKIMINLEIKSNHRADFAEAFAASLALANEMGMEDHILWKIPASKRGIGNADVPADLKIEALPPKSGPYLMPIVWESERDFSTQMKDFDGSGVMGFEIVAQNPEYWPTMKDGRIVGAEKYRYMGVAVLPRWSAGLSDEAALSSPDEAWGRQLELGVDLIMTDRPEQLIEYLKSRELR